jgi:WD40 repeat protein
MEFHRIKQIKAHSREIRHAQYSPDARMLATCSFDENVKIWRTDV